MPAFLAAERVPPALRGTIKVGLAVLLATGVYAIGDWLVDVISPGTSLSLIGYGYTVGAIALSYNSAAKSVRTSFGRRFVGTVGGLAIGIVCWHFPVGDVVTGVVAAMVLGWGFGMLIDGMGTADKAAYFAGITVLSPAENQLDSIISRSVGIGLGFLAVLMVVTWVWPTEQPEERRTPFTWRRPFG